MNLQRAIEIAVEAHKGQLDKGGNLYILHPLRVMMGLDTEDEKIVGVLHDVSKTVCLRDGLGIDCDLRGSLRKSSMRC